MRKQPLHPRTAILNQKDKHQSKKARLEALSWLAKRFPEAFCNHEKIRPLKIGIMEDVLQFADEAENAGISKSKLREAIVIFTRRVDYLTCLKAKEMRVDLDGNPTDPVLEEDAENASQKIRRRIEKSVRNARKSPTDKANAPHKFDALESSLSRTSSHQQAFQQERPYPSRPPAYSKPYNPDSVPSNAATVVVKHKTSRNFDPNAVARLKEKLGLNASKKTDMTSEPKQETIKD
jgi:ProP effector